MRETQRQVQFLTLRLRTVTNPDQFQFLLETLSDAYHHVINQGARGARKRHGSLGAILWRKAHDIALLRDTHRIVNIARQRTLAALDSNRLTVNVDFNAFWQLNRFFCNSGHNLYSIQDT